ncbi:p9 protein [Cardamine chlorotic fleck virus]|uniref:p9 protein n=1 Tax=Cardamine chlorotic fleck virus TaxID=31711 RepID=Q65989_9TOMB|nr:p9 protein [Cardamine chlorotic fleck virus]AAB02618.1 p9 protein [Cardamine chlorotic fleck virus]
MQLARSVNAHLAILLGVIGFWLLIRLKFQYPSISDQLPVPSPWVKYLILSSFNSLSLVLLLCHLIPDIKPAVTYYNTTDNTKSQHISISTANGN